MDFHLHEHTEEGIIQKYDQKRYGIPVQLSAIFLALRKKSHLFRVVVDAVSANNLFTEASHAMTACADV